ncbi:hypothetical protein IFM51744_10559 [Aspergillus udagawae]|nr:hypothetical protein IFM51744_10559 [Aspergillus udagawae]
MDDPRASILCDDLLIPIHGFGLAYFAFTALNLILNVAPLPLLEAQKSLPDMLAVFSFLLSAMAFSYFSLRHRFAPQHWVAQQAAIINLIAASTASFVFFQFRFDTSTRCFYMAAVWLTHGFYISSFLKNETSFISACLQCGFFALVPAIYATFRASSCQLPMTYNFTLYASFNAIGGLIYLIRLPERLGAPVSSSKALMHISVVGAAIVLSERLLAAHNSSTVFSIEECKALK